MTDSCIWYKWSVQCVGPVVVTVDRLRTASVNVDMDTLEHHALVCYTFALCGVVKLICDDDHDDNDL